MFPTSLGGGRRGASHKRRKSNPHKFGSNEHDCSRMTGDHYHFEINRKMPFNQSIKNQSGESP